MRLDHLLSKEHVLAPRAVSLYTLATGINESSHATANVVGGAHGWNFDSGLRMKVSCSVHLLFGGIGTVRDRDFGGVHVVGS